MEFNMITVEDVAEIRKFVFKLVKLNHVYETTRSPLVKTARDELLAEAESAGLDGDVLQHTAETIAKKRR